MNASENTRNYANRALNAARNGNLEGVRNNLARMNNAAVNSNKPLTPSEAREILRTVKNTNSKINGLIQNVGGVKSTLALPLKKNTYLRFTNNSRV